MNVVPLGNAVPLVRKADNGGSYRRVRAELIDCPCFLVDSFNKAAPEDAVVSPPHGQIGEIGGATVTARGVIQTRDGTIIRESLINLREQDVESLLAHPPRTATNI